MGWQYLLFEMDGQGGKQLINPAVKLSNPTLTRVLSGPHQITGEINVVDPTLAPGGRFQVKRWKSLLLAQQPNEGIFCGGAVADYAIDGSRLSLDVTGLTTYAKGQPYDAEFSQYGIDMFDVVRNGWSHLQNKPGGNIGLEIDDRLSGRKIGTPPEQVEFTTGEGENVSFTAGPIKLNWWSTRDLGGKIDELAKNGPFDYLEEHTWDGEVPRHFLRLGYPSIGSVKDLRFVLGENVQKMPAEQYDSEDVVTEVWVLGAGEGRTRIRGVASVAPSSSLRRVLTVDDKSIQNKGDATRKASDILALYQPAAPGAGITELFIKNHDHAPLGSYDVGDIIPYVGDHDWGPVEVGVKILKLTMQPEQGDHVVATVARADTIA